MLLTLAARNVRRSLRRTLLAAAAAALGVASLIYMRGFIDGLEESFTRLRVDTELAHLAVRPAGYAERAREQPAPVDQTLPADLSLRPRLLACAGVVAASPRLVFSAQLTDGGDALPVRAVGFVPEAERGLFDWAAFTKAPPPTGEQAWVGSRLLELLGATLGQTLTLLARTPDGAFTSMDVEVTGAVDTGNPAVDNFALFLPLASAQELLASPGRATEWIVRCDDRTRALGTLPADVAALDAWRGQVEVATWFTETSTLRRLNSLRRAAVHVLSAVLLLMGGLGIANVTLMAIYERSAEIGTMAALGISPRRIFLLFVLEGGLVGVLGATAGLLLGGAATLHAQTYGLAGSAALSRASNNQYPVADRIYARFDPATAAQAWLLCAACAALAAAFPALRASRRDPVALLREGRLGG